MNELQKKIFTAFTVCNLFISVIGILSYGLESHALIGSVSIASSMFWLFTFRQRIEVASRVLIIGMVSGTLASFKLSFPITLVCTCVLFLIFAELVRGSSRESDLEGEMASHRAHSERDH